MKQPSFNIKTIPGKLLEAIQLMRPYGVLLFVVFVAGLYGFVVLRISSLNNTEPSSDAVTTQVQAAKIPKVEPKVVKQLETLRDNSESVKTLFEDARNNPFEN